MSVYLINHKLKLYFSKISLYHVTTLSICLLALLSISALYPTSSPWLRISTSMNNLKMSKDGNFLAFTDSDGLNLRVLETRSGRIYEVTKNMVGQSFFWSPDECRLFYSELLKENSVVTSNLKGYDCTKKDSLLIEKYKHPTGILTFNPKDSSMNLISKTGIHRKTLEFEGIKTANKKSSKWLCTPKGVFSLSSDNRSLKRLKDDDSGVQSFDITSNGNQIVWSTKAGNIYTSNVYNKKPRYLSQGMDPKWNFDGKLLVFSGLRDKGNKISYDIKIADLNGNEKFLTSNPSFNKRWPCWYKDTQIIYTIENSTDVFMIKFDQM